jgi:hypothetical protein
MWLTSGEHNAIPLVLGNGPPGTCVNVVQDEPDHEVVHTPPLVDMANTSICVALRDTTENGTELDTLPATVIAVQPAQLPPLPLAVQALVYRLLSVPTPKMFM